MGSRGWVRLTAVAALAGLVALVMLGYITSSAPAGNRDPDRSLVGVPGPSEVTYGKNVAYSATLVNKGTSNYTHLTFRNPIPTTIVEGSPSPLRATFKYASCPGTLTATEFVCDDITLNAGKPAKVTIVWQTPTAGASADCPNSTPVCMTNSGVWQIKDSQPGSNDTFAVGPVVTSLLVLPDQRKAGGYPLSKCTDPASPSLVTNQAVGAANPLTTAVCASSLPVGDPLNPGVVVVISEEDNGPSDPGFTQVSDICIPATGQTCPSTTQFTFVPLATFTFVFSNPKSDKIDEMFHNGVPVSSNPADDPFCKITIDNPTKTTKAVCKGSTNGRWTGG